MGKHRRRLARCRPIAQHASVLRSLVAAYNCFLHACAWLRDAERSRIPVRIGGAPEGMRCVGFASRQDSRLLTKGFDSIRRSLP